MNNELLSIEKREIAMSEFKERNPEVPHSRVAIALDYEEYERLLAEKTAIIEIREKEIQRLRSAINGLRGIVERLSRT